MKIGSIDPYASICVGEFTVAMELVERSMMTIIRNKQVVVCQCSSENVIKKDTA